MGVFLKYMIILELGEMPVLIICLNKQIHYQIKILLVWIILISLRTYYARRGLQGSLIGAVKRKKEICTKKDLLI